MATVAVGDVHGHRDALDDVLAKIRDEIESKNTSYGNVQPPRSSSGPARETAFRKTRAASTE